MADVAITRAPASRAHIPTNGGVLLLAAALPELIFLVRFVVAWSGLFFAIAFLLTSCSCMSRKCSFS
jgi:hypothetical protein